MGLRLSRLSKWLLAAVVALLLVLALNWEGLALGLAAATAEHRPSLLDDAQWNQPQSASAFRHRFGNRSSEVDLLQWLSANHFKIDRGAGRAGRVVNGVPCTERIGVTWTATNGTISQSNAVVSEAGCL